MVLPSTMIIRQKTQLLILRNWSVQRPLSRSLYYEGDTRQSFHKWWNLRKAPSNEQLHVHIVSAGNIWVLTRLDSASTLARLFCLYIRPSSYSAARKWWRNHVCLFTHNSRNNKTETLHKRVSSSAYLYSALIVLIRQQCLWTWQRSWLLKQTTCGFSGIRIIIFF